MCRPRVQRTHGPPEGIIEREWDHTHRGRQMIVDVLELHEFEGLGRVKM